MTIFPARYEGAGTFKSLPHVTARLDRECVIGEVYPLGWAAQRSRRSHNHYFAELHEAWLQLPEHVAPRFPDDDVFRKHLLIKAGYHDSMSAVVSKASEAKQVAQMLTIADPYSVVVIDHNVITRYSARSQSLRAMGRKVFQQSKSEVLALAWEMVGVDPVVGSRNAGRGA